ncbi:glycoside hydrolase family 3 C-terminal domain-containing protein [Enterocloster bolteae]|uniref:glycoside hydrolase family 3 C-terminal domain-containing protein n=1 Tax=Enterocloster bolteae TaxID=208479 RepID=UPI00210ED7DF
MKAILQMGYAGEGAGKALADLLFGAACPGEKLAATHQRLPLSISDSGSLIVLPR